MAKDNPEDKTVPMYGGDGKLIGWTTEEKAGALTSGQNPQGGALTDEQAAFWGDVQFGYNQPSAGSGGAGQLTTGGYVPPSEGGALVINDRPGGSLEEVWPEYTDRITGGAADEGAYANELQKTGYWDDNSKVTLWDPDAKDYVTLDVDKDNIFEFNPRNDVTSWYINDKGERVLGFKPSNTSGYNWGDGMDSVSTPQSGIWRPGYEGTGGSTEQTPTTPTQPGGSTGGGSTSGGGVYQPPSQNPGVSSPTDDWFDVDWEDYPGYVDAPQPEGDGSFAPGNPPPDTSWDWDYWREKAPGDRQWGGYDQDYQAFERYQPGMESPWGMPNIQGGNTDFYQQQFVNALREEQGFRSRQRDAQRRAAEAAENPYEAPTAQEMWSWAYGGQGLPEVRLGTGQQGSASYTPLTDDFSGMTNQEMWQAVRDRNIFSPGGGNDLRQYMDNFFKRNPNLAQSNTFIRASDPGAAFSAIDPRAWQGMNNAGKVQSGLRDLMNQLYTGSDTGPYAPVGYASPIQWGGDYQSYAAAPQQQQQSVQAQAPTQSAPTGGGGFGGMSYEDVLASMYEQAPEIDWASEYTPGMYVQQQMAAL